MTMTFQYKKKIEKIVAQIYRGSKVNFEKKAQTQIANRTKQFGTNCQSVWRKLDTTTPDSQMLGAPENFKLLFVVVPKLGAGFIVALIVTL